MKSLITLLVFLFFAESVHAQLVQEEAGVQYSLEITIEDLQRHLEILASEEFEGRETGKQGQKKAARYIADHFSGLGLPPLAQLEGYNQEVPLVTEKWDEVTFKINGESYTFMKDFYAMPRVMPEIELEGSEVVFAGYGIEDDAYSDYGKKSVKDKIIVVFDGEPQTTNGKYLITGTTKKSKWSESWRTKLLLAKKKGAKAVLIVTPNIKRKIELYRYRIMGGSMRLADPALLKDRDYPPTVSISGKMAAALLGYSPAKMNKLQSRLVTKGKGKPKKRKSKLRFSATKQTMHVETENVLGFLQGTDLKDELIIITAHYDHLGKRGSKIYYGADDDGSGTSCLLEIAESFAKAKKAGIGPRRSILFMPVSGEEKGLLGSEYYSENPVFPLDKTVANLNIDMVGRVDKIHENENENYVYIIGADKLSTELHEINEDINKRYVKMNLDYTYNAEDDPNRFYYRSDHYNFAKNGIPVIFYFNGTHDDYHQPTDTVDKIDFPRMRERAQLVFLTAWQLANQDRRIVVDVIPTK